MTLYASVSLKITLLTVLVVVRILLCIKLLRTSNTWTWSSVSLLDSILLFLCKIHISEEAQMLVILCDGLVLIWLLLELILIWIGSSWLGLKIVIQYQPVQSH